MAHRIGVACVAAMAALIPPNLAGAEVRVAAVSDLTGPYSEVGRVMAAAKDLAIAQVNAQGGVLGGQPLTAVRLDGQCNADVGAEVAEAIRARTDLAAIIGATCSGATISIANGAAIPMGLLQVSPSATAPAISTLEDDDLVFRLSPSDSYLGAQLAGMILDRGVVSVGVTYAPDAYNVGVMEVFVETFRANGGTVTGIAEHVPGETDFASLIDGIAAPGTDSLVVFAYYDESGADVIQAALDDGRHQIFFGADGMIDTGLIERVGAENLGWALFMIAASDDTTPAFAAYADLAQAAGIDPRVAFTAASFDAAFLVALAIEAAGSTDPAAVRAMLREVANPPGQMILPGQWAEAVAALAAGEAIDYRGASGSVEFDAAGDTPGLVSVNTVLPDATWDVFVLR